MNLNINTSKCYTDQLRLNKALAVLGFSDHRHLVVCNFAGRFTAVFPLSNIEDGDVTRYARHGFMTLG